MRLRPRPTLIAIPLIATIALTWLGRDADAQAFKPRGKKGAPTATAPAATKKPTRAPSPNRVAAKRPTRRPTTAKKQVEEPAPKKPVEDDVIVVDDDE
jgi:hypothetical protein